MHVFLLQDEFFRLANAELKNYSMEIVSAYHEGFDGEPEKKINGNETIPEGNLHWTIPSSFLYSLTVITTIGRNRIIISSITTIPYSFGALRYSKCYFTAFVIISTQNSRVNLMVV